MKIGKIESIALFEAALPLKEPFGTSFGLITHRESLVLCIRSKNLEGFGDCAVFRDPFYSSETMETALHVCRDYLAPEILGFKNFGFAEIKGAFSKVRGHSMAKAMAENALLDLLAKVESKPLYELIGGRKKKVKSGIAIGIKGTTDELLAAVADAVSKKYHRVKIKIKQGADIEPIREVRKAFPNISLVADANGCYGMDDIAALRLIDEHNLAMLEQPLPSRDFKGHAVLKANLATPICLDESIECIEDAVTAVTLNSVDVINIKQGRVGGLIRAQELHAYCVANKLAFWAGGMLDTGIGRAVSLHLQTLPGFDMPGDISETARYFDDDIVQRPVFLDENGFLDIPDGPGIGVELKKEKLRQLIEIK